jgi:hypothetical protein
MDQDSPGRVLLHDLRKRSLQVAELRSRSDIARARYRSALAVLEEKDHLFLNLSRDALSQLDAESLTLLRNQLKTLKPVRDEVRQLHDKHEKLLEELIAAEWDLRLYTADKSNGRDSSNEGDLSSEHLNFGFEAETGGDKYFNSGLLQEWRKGVGKAARFCASHSARKDALETPLLAQPGPWLDW